MGNKRKYEDDEVDKELENGPIDKRGCTDICCCLFFLAALFAMYTLFTIALAQGQPQYLSAVYDYDKRACGLDAATKDYPYAYFTNPKPNEYLKVICVKQCPGTMDQTLNCKPTTVLSSCQGYNPNNPPSNSIVAAHQASEMYQGTRAWIYGSTVYFNTLCMPDPSVIASTGLGPLIDQGMGQAEKVASDMKDAWWVILSCVLVALVVGLAYMCLLRLFAGLIVFITIVAYLAGLIVLGSLMMTKSQDTSNGQNNSNLKYLAYAIWVVAGVSAIFFCCFRSALKLAVAIVKSAGQFLMNCKTVLFVPIVGQIVFIGVFAFWFVGFIYIYSMGTPTRMTTYPFNKFQASTLHKQYLYYWLFMGLWKQAFISALVQFIIASSCAIWYFSQGTGQLITMPVSKSLYRAFRYHLGSLAFGSFILAVVRFIRFLLYQLQKQAEAAGGKNKAVQFILGILQCYVACFERFIEFLNKNAYIQVAISGKNFCAGAKNAFVLILRNPVRFAMLGALGEIFSYLGILIVGCGGTFFGYAMCTYNATLKKNLHSPMIPTVCCFVLSMFIAIIFMSVYDMSIDTILQCFFLDEELAKSNANYVGHQPSYIKELMGEVDARAKEKADRKAKAKDDENASHNVRD